MFSCKYCEVFNNIYFEEHLGTTVSGLDKTTNIKIFRKTITLLFSNNKSSINSKITKIKEREAVTGKTKIADTFNESFNNIVKELNIEIDLSMFCNVAEKNDHVLIKGA